MRGLLDDLVTSLRRRPGVEYADARLERDELERVRMRDATPEASGRTETAGLAVRLLVRGAWGFASAPLDGDPGALAATVADRALEAARAAAQVSPGRVRLAETEPQRGDYHTPVAIDPFEVGLDRKLEALRIPIERLRADPGRRIQSARGHLLFRRLHKELVTSEGTQITQTLVHGSAAISAVAAWQGDVQQRTYPLDLDGGCAARGYEWIEMLDLAGNADRVREEAIALCAAPPLPATRAPIILSTEQLALQIHESCGHPTESDRALGDELSLAGGSFLEPSRLGRFRYGSPLVNLTADARLPGALGTFGWDDEGVPARRTPLVARGQFVGYLSSRETAARLGLGRSGGAARAESWARPPIIRMTNVSLEPAPGGPRLEELIADTKQGFLFSNNRSWSIDDLRLDFQFGCEAAWQIRDGKLGTLYKNPVYGGRTPTFWSNLDAVCGPQEFRMWGFLHCGKGDPIQSMWVGHGCAPARFLDVAVGSR